MLFLWRIFWHVHWIIYLLFISRPVPQLLVFLSVFNWQAGFWCWPARGQSRYLFERSVKILSLLRYLRCSHPILCFTIIIFFKSAVCELLVSLCVYILCGSGEACWWTVHPASRQRSEGEKVRVGDDLILVNVSSERYLVSQNKTEVFLNGKNILWVSLHYVKYQAH